MLAGYPYGFRAILVAEIIFTDRPKYPELIVLEADSVFTFLCGKDPPCKYLKKNEGRKQLDRAVGSVSNAYGKVCSFTYTVL